MNIGSSQLATADKEGERSAAQSAFGRLRTYLTSQIVGQERWSSAC